MFGLFSCDIGIDLGTANTLVHVAGKGIVINEPTVVAVDRKSERVTYIGAEAKKMLGRTPDEIIAVRPMKDGVIADYHLVEALLQYFISRVQRYPLFLVKPRVVVGVPSGITEVEKRAVLDATRAAGAREVHLVAEPMATAIGMQIPVAEPSGHMVIDCGGGTSEVAVISLGGLVCKASVRVGGDKMDSAIVSYLRRTHGLLIGESMAEDVKKKIGSAYPLEKELEMEVKGRDLAAGIPRTIVIKSEEIRDALSEAVLQIVEAVKKALESCPPELSADILDKGIIMAGGTSQLMGLDARLRHETGLPVSVIDDAPLCVCKGTARILESLDYYRNCKVLMASSV
ncbi:MAG: rod shape-determining protein [Candidatus Fibromonas sp.]|jgi:rod shape-determining protein MreB|nr:rod shape-determining protein [Candidatus Fibromonas sp.]